MFGLAEGCAPKATVAEIRRIARRAYFFIWANWQPMNRRPLFFP